MTREWLSPPSAGFSSASINLGHSTAWNKWRCRTGTKCGMLLVSMGVLRDSLYFVKAATRMPNAICLRDTCNWEIIACNKTWLKASFGSREFTKRFYKHKINEMKQKENRRKEDWKKIGIGVVMTFTYSQGHLPTPWVPESRGTSSASWYRLCRCKRSLSHGCGPEHRKTPSLWFGPLSTPATERRCMV